MAGAHRAAAAPPRRARVRQRRRRRRTTTRRCSARSPAATCSATVASRSSPTTTRATCTPGTSSGHLVFHSTSNPRLLRRAAAALPHRPPGLARPHRGAASSPPRCSPRLEGHGMASTSSPPARTATCTRGTPNGASRSPASRCSSPTPTRCRGGPVTGHITFRHASTPTRDSTRIRARSSTRRRSPTSTAPASPVDHRRHERGVPGGHRRRGRHQHQPGELAAHLGARQGRLALSFANGRVYAIKPPTGHRCRAGSPFLPGWPVKIGIIDAACCPTSGEGINGSPVVAPLACPSGGDRAEDRRHPRRRARRTSSTRTAARATARRRPRQHARDRLRGRAGRYDTPDLRGGRVSGVRHARRQARSTSSPPTTGLFRALDVAAPSTRAARTSSARGTRRATGQFAPGYPGGGQRPAVPHRPGGRRRSPRAAARQVIGGTSSLDLAAFDAGRRAGERRVAEADRRLDGRDPTLGSFGTLDTALGARKDVVSITRVRRASSVYRTPARGLLAELVARASITTTPTPVTTRATRSRPGVPMNGHIPCIWRRPQPPAHVSASPLPVATCSAARPQPVTSS